MTRLNSVSASAAEAILEDGLIGEPVAQWRRTWGRLLRLRSGQVGLFIIGMLILIAIFAPVLAPYDPDQVLIGVEQVKRREPPCVHLLGCDASRPQHIMGIDGNARDSFSRILYGTRVSLVIGLTTVTCALFFGVLLGAIAGYFRGWVDNIIMRIMDVILGFPSLLLAIAIVAVLGPGIRNALLAISIVSVPAYARVTRASVLSVKTFDFVAATRGAGWQQVAHPVSKSAAQCHHADCGAGNAWSGHRHSRCRRSQLPWPWRTAANAGMGDDAGAARNEIFSAPHLVFFPGLAIMLTVLGFNLLGDGLRDALDPRLHT